MVKKFTGRFFLAGVFICITVLSACSRQDQSPGNSAGTDHLKTAQRHSGKLMVRILPESPTSSDDLLAVFSGGGAVSWSWEKNGQILEDEKGPKLPKSRFAKGDTISVTVMAEGQEGNASVTIANSPPEIRSVRLTPDSICRGVDISAVPDGVDNDGDEIRYGCKWIINGEETADNSLVLKGDRIKKGDVISAAITPYDSYGAGKTYKTQAITVPKAGPCFISTPPAAFRGKIYTYNAVAKDPDGSTITYFLASSPPGMTIDEKNGRISWLVSEKSGGLHTIEVVALNSEGAKAAQRYSLNITLQSGASE